MSDIDLKEVNEFQEMCSRASAAPYTFVLSREMCLVFLIIMYRHKDK